MIAAATKPVASTTRTVSRAEILPLTGIRGVAAMWVLVGHICHQLLTILPGPPNFALRLASIQGPLGVDLFFLLSGMVISYNYADRFDRISASSWFEFIWLRFARLYPVHILMLLIYLGVVSTSALAHAQLDSPEKYSAGFFMANVFMVHAWSLPTHASWNGVAWSISCEWLAYLAFPLLCLTPVFRLRKFTCTLALVAVLLGMCGLCEYVRWDDTISYGVPRIIGEFIAGACLYNLYSQRAYERWRWPWILVLAAACLAVGFAATIRLGLWGFWTTPFMAAILLGAAYERGAICRFLSTRAMLFLGRISYSIYMVHMFCVHAVNRFYHVQPGSRSGIWLAMVVVSYIGFVLLVATASYYLVEAPCRRYLRKLWRGRGVPWGVPAPMR